MGDLQDPKMEVRKRTMFLAIFWGYIPLHSPYIAPLIICYWNLLDIGDTPPIIITDILIQYTDILY
jgi:hypothetical protein